MSVNLSESTTRLPSTPWGLLPPRLRVLFITDGERTGAWLTEAFSVDSASSVELEEAVGAAEGLKRLRDDLFDAVLIHHDERDIDALELLDAIRGGGSEDLAVIVIGESGEPEMSALCFEAGGDAYVGLSTATTRSLIWLVARSVERHRLIGENRKFEQAQRHRLRQEHEEATRLLEQQRAMIEDLEEIRGRAVEEDGDATSAPCPDLPAQLVEHYRELLRAYVIMGSGNMAEEMRRLADLLTAANVTAHQAMLLHLHVLEEMIRGLGSRSARHVMTRADMLILEVVIHLAEGYRERFRQRMHPPRQLTLF